MQKGIKEYRERMFLTRTQLAEKDPNGEPKERIIDLLKDKPSGLRSGKISLLLGVPKKEINRVLFKNKKEFMRDSIMEIKKIERRIFLWIKTKA